MKRTVWILLAAAILAGCAATGNVKPGFKAGIEPGYIYASEIDPGVIIGRWQRTRQTEALGSLWERYENPGPGEPCCAILTRGGYGQVDVYAYALKGRLRAFESFRAGHLLCYRELAWDGSLLWLKDALGEMLGISRGPGEGGL